MAIKKLRSSVFFFILTAFSCQNSENFSEKDCDFYEGDKYLNTQDDIRFYKDKKLTGCVCDDLKEARFYKEGKLIKKIDKFIDIVSSVEEWDYSDSIYTHTGYYPNGAVERKSTEYFKRNNTDDISSKSFYPSGELQWEVLFVDGNRDSTIYFTSNGDPIDLSLAESFKKK